MVFKKRTRNTRRGGKGAKGKKRFRRNKRKASKFFASQSLVKYLGARKLPYPPRYMTKFHSGFVGVIPTGGASATYNVYGNCVFTPWTNTTGQTFPGGLFPGTATINTLEPLGLTQMLSAAAPYQYYRVLSSKCDFQIMMATTSQVTVSTNTDVIEILLVPVQFNNTYATFADALEAPYSKNRLMNPYQRSAPVSSFMHTHTMFGTTRQAIKNDLSGNFGFIEYDAVPSDQSAWLWQVFYQTPDNAVTIASLQYRVDVTYYVELMSEAGANLSVV